MNEHPLFASIDQLANGREWVSRPTGRRLQSTQTLPFPDGSPSDRPEQVPPFELREAAGLLRRSQQTTR